MKLNINSRIVYVAIVIFSINTCICQKYDSDDYTRLRKIMVEHQIKDRGIYNKDILNAFLSVPRHLFVPKEYQSQAYGDFPLPIGFEQTISQPYIVAYMTDILKPDKNMKVLEIGTGSGYQAAILSMLCEEVYSIEIIDSLAIRAKAILEKQGYKNIIIKIGDGYQGWQKYAPFDAIIVTCAPVAIPQPLIDQLSEGGKMIIPAGEPNDQKLYLLEKRNNKIRQTETLPVRFVPMLRNNNQQQ